MKSPDRAVPRRTFLGGTALAAVAAAVRADDAPAAAPVVARRPTPPYRVWFQPRLFVRDVDLYRHMTLDASGWIDPRLAEPRGVTTLDWVYGLNHPSADGPGYWRDACTPAARSRPAGKAEATGKPALVSAGIAVDEWVPPAQPENERWLAEGLRAGKRSAPDVFVAVWSTDPTPTLFDLVRDGTVDLVLVEGYTHSVEPGLTTSWDGALRRFDAFADAGLADKTVFSFGHVTAQADSRGGHWDTKTLAARAEEIKRRHPATPGVAFFQSTDDDSPELRDLVRFCDRLSGDLWPDAG